jgi:hypothetical protein
MQLSIDQAETVIDTRVLAFQKPARAAENVSRLFYHLVFKSNKSLDAMDAGRRRKFFGFIFGCTQGLQGEIESIGGAGNGIQILVSLKSTQTPADFVKKLKLFSSVWAKRKLNLPDFVWSDVEVSTVSHSQRWQVSSYIQSRSFLF